jgi:hypothetical protein
VTSSGGSSRCADGFDDVKFVGSTAVTCQEGLKPGFPIKCGAEQVSIGTTKMQPWKSFCNRSDSADFTSHERRYTAGRSFKSFFSDSCSIAA